MIRIFRVFIPASVVGLLVSEILLVLACYWVAGYGTLNVAPYFYFFALNNYWKICVITACIILVLYFEDLYTHLRVTSRLLLVQQVCLAVGCGLLVMAVLGYLRPELLLGRWLLCVGSLEVIVVLPLWRTFYWRYIIGGLGSERVLLLGNSSILGEVIAHIDQHPEFGYTLLGYLCEGSPCTFPIPCLGTVDEVREVTKEYRATRIVVGMAERRNRLPVQQLLDIRFTGIMIEDVADTYEIAMRRVCSRQIQPSQLIFSSALGPRTHAIALQNFYSFLAAAAGLVAGSPLMLLTATLVKVSSKGPVLYRQKRVGKNGTVFTVYKFRSMYADAEEHSGPVWAKIDDPRITPIGRWLRRLRLDEIPQLWNVLRGDMALVGPRPERPEFVELLSHQIPYYPQRHAVKPGITGWAQINHKYGDSELDAMIKLEYDLYYIKNLAPALDFYIIFHTIKVMLLSRGAQ
ncbi:MAG TPA: sugar transferase [Bryobacteraceae bacterium]